MTEIRFTFRFYCFAALFLLVLPAVQAQFTFTTNDDSLTITAYTGTNEVVDIPSTTNGYPVVNIGEQAFDDCTNLAYVTIPDSVTNVGDFAFEDCTNLTSAYFQSNAPPDDGTVFQGDPVTVYYLYGATNWGATFGGAPTVEETIPNQFEYTINDGSITIAGLPGSGGAVVIPDLIKGYAVTSIRESAITERLGLTSVIIPPSVTNIGNFAFEENPHLTSVSIPDSVTSIGDGAFYGCTSLASITIPASVTNIQQYTFDGCYRLASVTIPASVTSIGYEVFYGCTSLTSVTIPASVTNIGDYTFEVGSNLISAYFLGNAPPDDGTVFSGDSSVTVYYLPGAAGWGETFGSAPAVLWNPQATALATVSGQFGFNITGPTNTTIVVEACTNLANPVWVPISTNILSGSGTSFFSDPQWTNYPGRYYRFSSP
jgi:BspA type Leucine rich repeat region (6 copies)